MAESGGNIINYSCAFIWVQNHICGCKTPDMDLPQKRWHYEEKCQMLISEINAK